MSSDSLCFTQATTQGQNFEPGKLTRGKKNTVMSPAAPVLCWAACLSEWIGWSGLGGLLNSFITGAPASYHYHLYYLCEHFIPATPMPKAISSLSALHAACIFKLLTFSLVELQQNAPGVEMPCAWCPFLPLYSIRS